MAAGRWVFASMDTVDPADRDLFSRLARRRWYGGRKGRRANRRLDWEIPLLSVVYVDAGPGSPPETWTEQRTSIDHGRYGAFRAHWRVCVELRGGLLWESDWLAAQAAKATP